MWLVSMMQTDFVVISIIYKVQSIYFTQPYGNCVFQSQSKDLCLNETHYGQSWCNIKKHYAPHWQPLTFWKGFIIVWPYSFHKHHSVHNNTFLMKCHRQESQWTIRKLMVKWSNVTEWPYNWSCRHELAYRSQWLMSMACHFSSLLFSISA